MPPTTKIAQLLGLVSLGAAVALIAVACAGRAPEGGHTAAHLPSPLPPQTTSAPPPSPAVQRDTPAALPAAAKCRATVTLVESWPGGYRGAATITNDGEQPLGGWYIQWMLPQGATLTQAWNGTHMQSGPVAMIHALGDRPPLRPGATATDIGFVGAAATPPTFTEITCG
ncbi:cellulose binding domain-containing protein [Streptosporangium sp. NPDC001681]|uniref:cellulose binding domain-containing protein n=1 Tax=Streptosporangium sp. NPDC001681 TaxID=3154395 RepID=UPI00332D4D5F